MKENLKESLIIQSKNFRKALDEVRLALNKNNAGYRSRERSLAMTRIEEAIMWLGMDLKALTDGKSCYEHGYDDTPIVDPVPDGVLGKGDENADTSRETCDQETDGKASAETPAAAEAGS